MDAAATIAWTEDGQQRTAAWRAESGVPAPRKVVLADDRMPADQAYKLACEGTALLWRGDYHNGRQLLQALARRIDARAKRKPAVAAPDLLTAFHQMRQAQGQRARILGMLLLPVQADYSIALRRAPDARAALEQVYGAPTVPFVLSLRELLGVIGAYEWRKNGVDIPALGARIHPHYGVFSPIRGEYVQLVADAALPAGARSAFDIGTGTGVLTAVLAKRGLTVTGTDQDARALACARENLARLGLAASIIEADLFPAGRADLVVCNPPWLPGRPSAALEYAIYDPDSRMLRGFLDGLAAHLNPGGEGWLILSDLAEKIGLRSRAQLLDWIGAAGLVVAGRIDTKPQHPRSRDVSDPLHAARAAETTSLWRLRSA
ncbi:class I SAM-dependent methyltransferase [Massilia sp. TS11]|uniref:methyltransferase n=1 Tax=Massilia sp. TS11 TaxID=2908003 RepID=UPI001EDBDEA9|nr:class I SAM-dependent methyltransferase [Massilia sp. TS11]MCG2583351.1 class I SAM-dependent methyltransferase [Massilia sp. TS11]